MARITKEFDEIIGSSHNSNIRIARATESNLRSIYPKMDEALAHRLAPLKTCERIRLCNPDNMWAIFNQTTHSVIGLYANIMLSKHGHAALLKGQFRPNAPSANHTATHGEVTHAIYTWAVLAPGRAVVAIPMIAEKLKEPNYKNIDIYGNGMTTAGRNIMEALGFRRIKSPDQTVLYKYRRLANREQVPKSPNSKKEYNNV